MKRPKCCRWCKSPYWNKPVERESVSESSRRRGEEYIPKPPEPEPAAPEYTLQQLAASIPGVHLGFNVTRPTSADTDPGEPIDIGDAPMEEVRPWLPELTRIQRIAESDPGEAYEQLQTLTHGRFKIPDGWARWSLTKRAEWLEAHHPLNAE